MSADDFCREIGIARSTIGRRFGTWHELRRQASLPPRKLLPAVERFSAEDVRQLLRSLVASEGDRLTYTRFRQLSRVSDYTVTKHFGNWSSLRRQLGLAPLYQRQQRVSNGKLLVELDQLVRQLQRFPSAREIQRMSKYPVSTYYARFGSKRHLQKALRIFRIEAELERRLGPTWRQIVFRTQHARPQ